MSTIKTICPSCGTELEFPPDFDNIICSTCQTSFRVRIYKQTASLLPLTQKIPSQELIEEELAKLQEAIESANSEIELIKSQQQGIPLEIGCTFFGIFGMLILVLAFFITLGRNYFGGWLFYLIIAAVIAVGVIRMRGKLRWRDRLDQLRQQRQHLETVLAQLETERDRLLELRNRPVSCPEKNGG
jgi:LSD1 subclass zinc finger protein